MAQKFRSFAVATWLGWFLLGLVLLLFFLLQKIRAENHHAMAEMESLQREATTLRHTIDAAAKPPPPIAHATSTGNATGSARDTETKAPKSGGLKSYSDDNAITDPEGGAAIMRRHRRYAMGNYRGAIDSLQLAAADKERLKALIAERWLARTDVYDLLGRQGGATDELRKKMMDTVVEESNQKIRALVGEAGFAKLEAAYDEHAAKISNSGLFAAAWDAGAPLTAEQQTRVARAIVQVRTELPSPEANNAIDPATGITRADVALLEAVSSFLSLEQIAVIRADQTALAEYQNAVHEAQQKKQADASGRIR